MGREPLSNSPLKELEEDQVSEGFKFQVSGGFRGFQVSGGFMGFQVSSFRRFQVSGGFKFQEVSEGFRRFQRVSNANVGFKFQVSEGFRWFQKVSEGFKC